MVLVRRKSIVLVLVNWPCFFVVELFILLSVLALPCFLSCYCSFSQYCSSFVCWSCLSVEELLKFLSRLLHPVLPPCYCCNCTVVYLSFEFLVLLIRIAQSCFLSLVILIAPLSCSTVPFRSLGIVEWYVFLCPTPMSPVPRDKTDRYSCSSAQPIPNLFLNHCCPLSSFNVQPLTAFFVHLIHLC